MSSAGGGCRRRSALLFHQLGFGDAPGAGIEAECLDFKGLGEILRVVKHRSVAGEKNGSCLNLRQPAFC